jgi:hypothetical protein
LDQGFFDPWFVYPPAAPVDIMVIPRTSEKNNNVQINDKCQGQWRAGLMNRIIFQPNGTPMVPIFHHSIVPLFQFKLITLAS